MALVHTCDSLMFILFSVTLTHIHRVSQHLSYFVSLCLAVCAMVQQPAALVPQAYVEVEDDSGTIQNVFPETLMDQLNDPVTAFRPSTLKIAMKPGALVRAMYTTLSDRVLTTGVFELGPLDIGVDSDGWTAGFDGGKAKHSVKNRGKYQSAVVLANFDIYNCELDHDMCWSRIHLLATHLFPTARDIPCTMNSTFVDDFLTDSMKSQHKVHDGILPVVYKWLLPRGVLKVDHCLEVLYAFIVAMFCAFLKVKDEELSVRTRAMAPWIMSSRSIVCCVRTNVGDLVRVQNMVRSNQDLALISKACSSTCIAMAKQVEMVILSLQKEDETKGQKVRSVTKPRICAVFKDIAFEDPKNDLRSERVVQALLKIIHVYLPGNQLLDLLVFMEMKHGKHFLVDCKYKLECISQILGELNKSYHYDVIQYLSFFVDRGRVHGGAKGLSVNVLSGRNIHAKSKRKRGAPDDNDDDTSTALFGLVHFSLVKSKSMEFFHHRYPVCEDLAAVFKDISSFQQHFPESGEIASDHVSIAWLGSLSGYKKLWKDFAINLFSGTYDDHLKAAYLAKQTMDMSLLFSDGDALELIRDELDAAKRQATVDSSAPIAAPPQQVAISPQLNQHPHADDDEVPELMGAYSSISPDDAAKAARRTQVLAAIHHRVQKMRRENMTSHEVPMFASKAQILKVLHGCKAISTFKGAWNKRHRAFVIDFNGSVPPVQPWRGQCHESTCGAMIKARIEAACELIGSSDLLFIFCGHGEPGTANRKFVEDVMSNKNTFFCRPIILTYKEMTATRDKNRGFASAGNFEELKIFSLSDPYVVKKKKKSEDFGGESTASQVYSHLDFQEPKTLVQVTPEELKLIFPDTKHCIETLPLEPDKLEFRRLEKNHRGVNVPHWHVRVVKFLQRLLEDTQVYQIVDLTTSVASFACGAIDVSHKLTDGKPDPSKVSYVGLTNSEAHTKYVNKVLDQHFLCALATPKHCCYNADLALDIRENFSSLFDDVIVTSGNGGGPNAKPKAKPTKDESEDQDDDDDDVDVDVESEESASEDSSDDGTPVKKKAKQS